MTGTVYQFMPQPRGPVYCPRPARKVPVKAICWTCGAAGLLAFWLAALWYVVLFLGAMAEMVR